jgi:nickel superoxide dismutase
MMKNTVPAVVAALLVSLTASRAFSHCQIPCGIFDDSARFTLMAEHIATIEKSMNAIVDLSTAEKPNGNQMVRWVHNKDQHADELGEIITYYFMAQRINPPPEGDEEARAKYLVQLTSLHEMLVHSMKAKQTTALEHVDELRALLEAFKASYLPDPSAARP